MFTCHQISCNKTFDMIQIESTVGKRFRFSIFSFFVSISLMKKEAKVNQIVSFHYYGDSYSSLWPRMICLLSSFPFLIPLSCIQFILLINVLHSLSKGDKKYKIVKSQYKLKRGYQFFLLYLYYHYSFI